MKKLIAFIYGVICYLIFFASFLWMILFLGGFEVYAPTAVNEGVSGSLAESILINLGLIALFGVQHTVMARKSFKEWWTKFVPQPLERSTYVLFSAIALILILWFWQPLPETVWHVDTVWVSLVLQWGFWLGWLVLFLSTWMIDHFNLFGLKQVWNYMRGIEQHSPQFMEPGFYKYVRHPLMLGFLIAFWSIPHMTVGHFIFSGGMTLYILIGVFYEEKAMVQRFGNKYKDYRDRVPKFFPRLKVRKKESQQEEHM
ncbi:isoprenylcysteine carboxylmethyltransferase family protein [Aliifodinibius halophilus]|uniref:methanethiol S-methyltransferase n=2 Tax=Fodinibius halophilus TaxID=1736908 RepID=A0A6M1SYW1_9BACT|nr:isoprenylcysteine carboxylmethyltransferase family protein [Fodinibius halophilus]